jgi:hypothetical protein
MKLLLLVVVLFSKILIPPPAPVHITFVPLTKKVYLAARKGAASAKPSITFPLKKQHGRILIPTGKGKKVFTDKYVDTDRDDQQQFEYLGYLPRFECHVVLGHFYEWSQWFLITKSGQQLELYDAPEYSPDLQYFVSASQGLEYSVYPNTIRLFHFENHTWREVWHLEPKAWEPKQVNWLSPNTLSISQKHWASNSSRIWCTYVKLTFH